MSFNGIGAPGAMLGINLIGNFIDGVILPRGRYSTQINAEPNPLFGAGFGDNLVWQKGDFRTPVTPEIEQNDRVLRADRGALQALTILPLGGQSDLVSGLLGPCQGAFDPPHIDSGVLTTADPFGTDAQGIPINFGRGRGKWTESDKYIIRTRIVNQLLDDVCQDADNGGPLPYADLYDVSFIDPDGDGLGDLELRYHNVGAVELPFGMITLDFIHSISR